MKLLQFIVKRKILIGLIFAFIVVAGIISTDKIGKKLLPTQTMDGVVVQLVAGNLEALNIEEQIVTPLEQRFKDIDGFEEMESTINLGISSTRVYFEEGKGEKGHEEIQSILNSLSPQLNGLQDYYTFQMSSDQPFEFFMEISNGDLDEMTSFAKNVLKTKLEALPEVREVALTGLKEYEVNVQLDQEKLNEHDVNPTQIFNLIQNSNTTTSLGEFTEEENTPLLRWDTTYSNIEDLKHLPIPTINGNVNLDEIADITLEPVSKVSTIWKEGETDLILVEIGRVSDVTQIEMAKAVRAEVEEIRNENLVKGFHLNEIVAQSDYVESSIDGVQGNVLIGGIIALVMLLLFLRNIRATIIIGFAIPSSILLTFTAMWLFDQSFNMVTLIALGLGIGMMVDSSIVILESIYQKKEQGLSNFDAVIQGTKEVASAVVASMLTTIVVFVPIGFVEGEIGLIVSVLAIIVAITIISSVVVSFTLIPTLAEKFLKVEVTKKKTQVKPFITFYGSIVRWITKKLWHRLIVILLFIAIFIGSISLLSKIPMNVMPDIYNRYAELIVTMEAGLSEEKANETITEMGNRLSAIEDVETNYVIKDANSLIVLVNMTKDEKITREQKDVNEDIMSSLRGMTDNYPIESVAGMMGGGGGYPVHVLLKGQDFDKLNRLASNFITELNKIDGIVGANHSNENQSEAKKVMLNESALEEDGIASLQIKQMIENFSLSMPVGEMQINEEYAPITMSLGEPLATEVQLLNKEIKTLNGTEKLSKYISLETISAPNQIVHHDTERVIVIRADIENRDLGAVNRDVQQVIEQFNLPTNYTLSLAGQLEDQQQAMNEMVLVLLTAIFLVYVVMAVQFNHLAHPIVVMSVIPMTFVGAILGLLVTQQELNIMSGVGVIMLIGIILNNAILLLDRTKQLRNDGQSIGDALVEAGKNRLRPIFLTTFTTAGGMLPLALASGTAGNFQSPLAIVIISGLLFGTFITLVLVPSVYMIFNDIARGFKKIFSKSNKKVISNSIEG
ncbi:HAE1 family hydrophobic/amphiphilic exporter-1 [Salirhabdus euzebyi]|uniref:HAE1 family hydrophobic/amphiphilic exporter-1 n=1 Tax=Salirhabdus euzebyi TaxID=394506 RepID=A0A841Q4R9_9BACI|nr:efflux RND transporter permease subunit [Salirhabdus euzebyi]MBB6453388.1 HAE1 family hydrophobic/amphiphilic exporter-1 [Salirhabdus euzebyi]